MNKIYELCPYCDTEVKLKNEFKAQVCPSCGRLILPCSICEYTNPNGCHTKCNECPLDKLDGTQISSASIYYENIRVIDNKGCEFYLKPQTLTEILSKLDFKVERKRKRSWLVPSWVKTEETLPIGLTATELSKLKEVLDQFEHATLLDTGTKKISGGFAIAEFDNCDGDWIYITLKWGVQSDCESTFHTEDWKLAREVLSENKTAREMVVEIIECN